MCSSREIAASKLRSKDHTRATQANYKDPKSQQAEWFELTAMRGGYRRSVHRSRPAPRWPTPNPCPPPPGQPHQQPSPTGESEIQTESRIRPPVPSRSQPKPHESRRRRAAGAGPMRVRRGSRWDSPGADRGGSIPSPVWKEAAVVSDSAGRRHAALAWPFCLVLLSLHGGSSSLDSHRLLLISRLCLSEHRVRTIVIQCCRSADHFEHPHSKKVRTREMVIWAMQIQACRHRWKKNRELVLAFTGSSLNLVWLLWDSS